MPRYRQLSGRQTPPEPFLLLQIVDNLRQLTFGPVGAIVDSGADYTCIPRRIADNLEYAYGFSQAEDFAGAVMTLRLAVIEDARVSLFDDTTRRVAGIARTSLRLPIVESDEALIGRDILNHFVCTLDGPKLLLSITDAEEP